MTNIQFIRSKIDTLPIGEWVPTMQEDGYWSVVFRHSDDTLEVIDDLSNNMNVAIRHAKLLNSIEDISMQPVDSLSNPIK